MGINAKLEEVQLVNKLKGNTNHTVQCMYRFGEKTLVVIKSYMEAHSLTNETQAVRELLQLGFINSVANGEE